jgi:FixJ family two-component response regulator
VNALVDLLIGLVHKINARADRRVQRELTEDPRRVRGKEAILPAGRGGVEATRRLREHAPGIKVIVLTTYADDRSVIDALRAGARGFLTKDAGAEDIKQAIEAVMRGEASIDPAVQHHLVNAVASGAAPTRPEPTLPDGLTPREAEGPTLIAEGLSNAEIATRLVLSEATVKSHITVSLPRPESATAPKRSATPTAAASRRDDNGMWPARCLPRAVNLDRHAGAPHAGFERSACLARGPGSVAARISPGWLAWVGVRWWRRVRGTGCEGGGPRRGLGGVRAG